VIYLNFPFTFNLDDIMLENKKFKEQLESIDTRITRVRQFLETIRQGLNYEVCSLSKSDLTNFFIITISYYYLGGSDL
jgi:hypothetical protein